MSEGECPSQRIIIPKGTLDPSQNNVIDIPEACEDSSVLIARLQARFGRPPGYYPPLTNPDNKFERKIGDHVVGLGLPPLSPLKEERIGYQPSLSQYGSPKYESYEPSYFGHDTTHGSQSISGKFDYCPTSTPKGTRPQAATEFPSPQMSPIRMGRDIFAPEPSVYRPDYTPTRAPPRPPSPSPSPPRPAASPPRPAARPPRRPSPPDDSSCSCGSDNLSSLLSRSGSSRGAPPPRMPSPKRPAPPPQRGPMRRPAPATSDRSISLGNISDMFSFDESRANRPSIDYTPESLKGMSQIYGNLMATPKTPIPEELHNTNMKVSMAELDSIEIEELQTLQERIRNFQEARRELVLSIISLPEAELAV